MIIPWLVGKHQMVVWCGFYVLYFLPSVSHRDTSMRKVLE